MMRHDADKMKQRKVLEILAVLFTICSGVVLSEDTPQLPFCKICKCHYDDNDSPAEVTCTTDVKNSIVNQAFWINSANNESFNYGKISFTNNRFINLTFIFPKSDLTYLNLDNNDIFSITDSVFQNLQNMETLILSNNDLELLHPDAFKGLYMEERLMPLKSLKELRLNHNKLHTLYMNIFEHTTDMEILDLSYNPLELIDQHTLIAIVSLVRLRELDLSYTQIKTLPDNMMHTPAFLRVLDLSGNPIEKVPDTLRESHNLTDLYLNYTAFVNITKDNGFPDIPTLRVLHMCHLPQLQRIHKGSLAGLTNLEELRLSDNIDFSFFDSLALAKVNEHSGGAVWPALRRLYIQNNKLAYIDSDIIARWDSLTELDIRDNPWTCECENQWLIDDLMPIYLKIDSQKAMQVQCAAPIEMAHYSFYDLYQKNYQTRCLDMYGARPEKDAAMLVGILAGILLAIPLILLLIFAYQRRWFGICGICDNSPASYSRRFYSATSSQDEYI